MSSRNGQASSAGPAEFITLDANEAVADVAYRLTEASIIYPITPSSPMGEFADEWAAHRRTNLWGLVPRVVEMQSEAGAAGTVHGVLQAGALATTYTASQGLLLMIPNLYKIAGEQLPMAIHVAARTLASHALSIFGDHQDVMACRQCGLAMLASNAVQEAHDLAAIAHAATLEASLPVMHFFDGFRTSHEVGKIERLSDDILRSLIDEDAITRFRGRAMNPDMPSIRGTAQNPDVFFQTREASNVVYDRVSGIVQSVMDRFRGLTGRAYKLFDYEGAADAERVIIVMGSGAETCATTAQALNESGEKVGVLKVRLYRPFDMSAFVAALPTTTKTIAVLDRTKEPGAPADPLYLDVVTALHEHFAAGRNGMKAMPRVIGGRFGLSSKEFTPGMVKAIYDELSKDQPKARFTVGIYDDVTNLSLPWDTQYDIEPGDCFRAVFYGLGADGTVGANKNSIKIIGEQTDLYAQGYFVYDSKKSGAMTVSHLRFGPSPIRSPYLIGKARFIGCHQFVFLERIDVTTLAEDGAVLLLNAPYAADEVWGKLPRPTQQAILDKHLKVYTIDALKVARDAGMGSRINTVMQTCFFAISGVLPRDEAIAHIKKSIEKTYGKKGPEVVKRNWAAVDATVEHLHEVRVPASADSGIERIAVVPPAAPDFVKHITAKILAGEGDQLPVSCMLADGTWPTDTAQWEKRGIASEIPIWEPDVCIQCGKCAFVCPHAAIRIKAFDPEKSNGSLPGAFKHTPYKGKEYKGWDYVVQVAPDDCTGCHLCTTVCPAKDRKEPRRKAINMSPRLEHLQVERENWDAFDALPEPPRDRIVRLDAKGSQFFDPLFEFSGACAGCGETPYLKLLTQLFGDRMMIANATGCSSIYGGNLPTTPWATDREGRGPTWANSLFEDNAEFGLGLRLSVETQQQLALVLLEKLRGKLGDEFTDRLIEGGKPAGDVAAQRAAIRELDETLARMDDANAKMLRPLTTHLQPRSVWIIGGDGWAYDIGYGGLDHVLASGANVNVLVLDTEVYSNTGGQASKSTPLAAAAKFAAAGKAMGKKDLGLMAMSYGHVYVAHIAFGANDNQTVKALLEAESYPGPSLVIAYSHCIAHGYDLRDGLEQQELAVHSGHWPLLRFDPRRVEQGLPPLQLDSKAGRVKLRDYHSKETRFRMVQKLDPARYEQLEAMAEKDAAARVNLYQQLSQVKFGVAESV